MEYARGTDEELVRRFRDGDTLAFEALLDRYSRSIYNFTLRMLDDGADADDATQQTFIQAFESLPGVRPDVPIRPWLFQVARNKCIDLIRRRRTVPMSSLQRNDEEPIELDPPDPRPRPEEMYEHAELQQILQDAISDLPLRTREVVVMRYVGELTFAEIGETLGMPENTAKTLFQRAKPQLRTFIRRRMA
jgi:RNA polymerase sigma factor (sigma-70 family)